MRPVLLRVLAGTQMARLNDVIWEDLMKGLFAKKNNQANFKKT